MADKASEGVRDKTVGPTLLPRFVSAVGGGTRSLARGFFSLPRLGHDEHTADARVARSGCRWRGLSSSKTSTTTQWRETQRNKEREPRQVSYTRTHKVSPFAGVDEHLRVRKQSPNAD